MTLISIRRLPMSPDELIQNVFFVQFVWNRYSPIIDCLVDGGLIRFLSLMDL